MQYEITLRQTYPDENTWTTDVDAENADDAMIEAKKYIFGYANGFTMGVFVNGLAVNQLCSRIKDIKKKYLRVLKSISVVGVKQK